ncbi:hypothetical protein [Algibacter sp. 2305UL17-15]|uniref:hypothetical protein n=1 Tax=Algibacter sp. 2305UL17-15 TaxID=3231268 RepID=UPI00345A252A
MTSKKIKRIFFLTPILLVVLLVSINYVSTYKIQFSGYYSTKIWGHRANSLEKLKLGEKYFIGVELDLIYSDSLDILDVNHPPAASTNLSFNEYLSHIKDKKPNLWLDIKNLTPSNSKAILFRIDSLLKRKNVSNKNILIESNHPEVLPFFSDSGYKTSYYLPYLHDLKESKRRDTIMYIKSVLEQQPEVGISSHFLSHPIMKQNFPDTDKYFWVLGNLITFRSFFDIRNVLDDDSVKIVLVSY